MTVLQQARESGRGVGAFNVILLEHAEAIVAGAEAAGLPVILQISQNCVQYHGALEPILAGTLAVARNSQVPAVVHLDHADDEALVRRALELGVHSVMFDASHDSYEVNVRRTSAVAELCHSAGIPLEAELGKVGVKHGVHAPGVRTDPAEAKAFVEATGADSLAVAVGSSQAMTERTAVLDLDLIAALAQAVPVPLVLHGSSGVSDEQLAGAVRAGLVKVNISTHLNGLFTRAVRRTLAADERVVDPRKYIVPGRIAVADEVERLLRLLAPPKRGRSATQP
ncbi:class II fructose-bisphosphate aldolase family protein [Kineosporia rhizophila]|uniref:class II fructose-bisphosphate aldolase n=1 Tax=Kineosporia rhizophila TaxID=84633 RepID=UPI001E2C9B60|nr:class II fructose-bisphosphate aldolase [Kineosporia rhizophila]MCE0537367.1 class II fructose-bisphosphate aldolase family protein [Kineosporia rhizophila]